MNAPRANFDPFAIGLNQMDLSDEVNGQTFTRADYANAERNPVGINANNSTLRRPRDMELQQLRASNPFVPVVLLPNASVAIVLVANVAQDLPIPSGAKYMTLKGTADYWLGVNGTAVVPLASQTANAPILRPDGINFFVQEMQSVSVVAAVDCIVSAMFYFQQ